MNWQQDPHGNWLARLVFPGTASELKVEVDLSPQMTVINPFDFFVEPSAASLPFGYSDDLKPSCRLSATSSRALYCRPMRSSSWRGRARSISWSGSTRRLRRRFAISSAWSREFRRRRRRSLGRRFVPRLGVAAGPDLSAFGLAARFVSGYLIQLRPDIDPVEGPAGGENDFTDLHAWAEVYLPGAGWIGFDVTSGLLSGEGHLPVAAAPHYRSASPIDGRAGLRMSSSASR